MKFSVKAGDPAKSKTDILVVALNPTRLSGLAATLDKASGGQIKAAVKACELPAKVGKSLLIPAPQGIAAARLLLVAHPAGKLAPADFRKLASTAAKAAASSGASDALWALDEVGVNRQDGAWKAREAAVALSDATYHFTGTVRAKASASKLDKVAFTLTDSSAADARKGLALGQAIAAGISTAKDLGNMPPNICNPAWLVTEAKKLARGNSNLKVSALTEKQMTDLGMGAFMSVSQGSDQPGYMIVMEYQGAKVKARGKRPAPVVLVGKGITFDTGGISLKPGAAMDEMKYDMCGAAAVFGTMRAAVDMKLELDLVVIIAAAENMPSGNASRPGDVVTTMSGQTVEILNTDAEGRLVLCDALTFVEKFKPAAVVDVATLTGAMVIALGKHPTGMFANNDTLADALVAAGENTGDRTWRMPLWEEYQNQLDSNFADMANIGGREAGSVTAACFLSRYTQSYPWAHLDIAGTAWLSGGAKGATGRPVAMLSQYLLDCAAAAKN